MALLSVIIPISDFDERHYRCQSLILNSLENKCEVILVIDASSIEKQQFIANKFLNIIDKRFKMEIGNFGNPGSARNFGLKKATSEWVAFWDSDDFSFVENILRDIKEYGEGHNVLVGKYRRIRFLGEKSSIAALDSHKKNLSRDIDKFVRNLGLWRMVFRRKRIEGYFFPSISMAEDKVFFASIGLIDSETYFSDLEYYEYSVGSPLTLTGSKKSLGDLRIAITILEKSNTRELQQNLFKKKLMRQLGLTCIKKGNISLKLFGLRAVILSLKSDPIEK